MNTFGALSSGKDATTARACRATCMQNNAMLELHPYMPPLPPTVMLLCTNKGNQALNAALALPPGISACLNHMLLNLASAL